MAEMVCSAFVQEAVSRGISFVLGKREAAASQGHLMERVQRAANQLERALERTAKLVITDVSLLRCRNKFIKPAYIEAMELLERHRQQQAVPAAGGQEDHQLVSRGQKKRKLWMVFRANTQDVVPVEAPSSAGGGLDMTVVQRLEQSADWGRDLVRDVESACSLWSNNLCSNPVARHLFQGRSLSCLLVQGNQRRSVDIWPLRSEERGVEVMLWYSYYEHDSTPMEGKTFRLTLLLRLSESVDIVGVAIKGLEYLASQFMLGTESAVEELTLLPTLLQGLAPSPVPWEVDPRVRLFYSWCAREYRPDPACCGASRLGLCSSNNNVSSELSHVFPEEVICFLFRCYISAAVEPPNSSRSRGSSLFGAGRNISSSSMVGWTPPPLAVSVHFAPHKEPWALQSGSLAVVEGGDVETERRDESLQQVSQRLKSDAINCFLRQPELTNYSISWRSSRHGTAWFQVQRPRIQPTRRRYNTRASTKPSARRLM